MIAPRSLLALVIAASGWLHAADPPSGDAVIRGKAGESEIVITTTSRLAGAIHSLKWNNREFIDSADHGRQLQSACSFDAGSKQPFWAECFNPTEAGSRRDGAGPTSSSRLLSLKAEGNRLQTRTQMAFWLQPGEKSSGRLALNDKVLSQHIVEKQVQIGYKTWPQAIESTVTFSVPDGEKHTSAQFEALTGYMPPEFREFWKLDLSEGRIHELTDGPGEQRHPVIFSTKDKKFAMGVFSPDQPSKGFEQAGYGRFRFSAEKVVKWNCVFRVRDPQGIPPGQYPYRLFVAVGTLENVRETLIGIAADLRKSK
jgi:hypothetical protein